MDSLLSPVFMAVKEKNLVFSHFSFTRGCHTISHSFVGHVYFSWGSQEPYLLIPLQNLLCDYLRD